MPRYTMKNTETDEIFDVDMKISERDAFLSENPHFCQMLSTPAIGDGSLLHARKHISKDFSNILTHVKKTYTGGTIND